MKNELAIADTPDRAQSLLEGLIAECHQIIRELVVPSATAVADDHERRRYLTSAVELVRIAAAAGDTVARLRGGASSEVRQRIVVEKIERSGTLKGQTGG